MIRSAISNGNRSRFRAFDEADVIRRPVDRSTGLCKPPVQLLRCATAGWFDFAAVRSLLLGGVMTGIALLTAGCSPPTVPVDSLQDIGIATIGRLYGEYATRHDGVGPADAATFRAFLSELPAAQREAMGLTDLDSALTSKRDGLSFTILYGVDTRRQLTSGGLQRIPIVVHESQGRDGKRLIATGFGTTRDVAPAEFDVALNGN